MSELAKLTAAPRTDLLPGHTLSRFGIAEFALAEQEFAQQHLATAIAAGEKMPLKIKDSLLRMAMNDVRDGHFFWGRLGFDSRCASKESVPFLLWVSLHVTEPTLTRAEALALITPENGDKLHTAVLELMDFDIGVESGVEKKGKAAPTTSQPEQPTGEESSDISEKSAA